MTLDGRGHRCNEQHSARVRTHSVSGRGVPMRVCAQEFAPRRASRTSDPHGSASAAYRGTILGSDCAARCARRPPELQHGRCRGPTEPMVESPCRSPVAAPRAPVASRGRDSAARCADRSDLAERSHAGTGLLNHLGGPENPVTAVGFDEIRPPPQLVVMEVAQQTGRTGSGMWEGKRSRRRMRGAPPCRVIKDVIINPLTNDV
jgi:hypothetical protein